MFTWAFGAKKKARKRARRIMKRLEPRYPALRALHEKVLRRRRLARYLASPRRIPFNRMGIFRHYPELDDAGGR